MEKTSQAVMFTRDDLVMLADAIEEFRDEYSGPHLDANRARANEIRELLRGADDEWRLLPVSASVAEEIRTEVLRETKEALTTGEQSAAVAAHNWRLQLDEDGHPTPASQRTVLPDCFCSGDLLLAKLVLNAALAKIT